VGVGGARELTLTVGPEAWMMDMKSASWGVVLVADSSVVCLGGQEGMGRVGSCCRWWSGWKEEGMMYLLGIGPFASSCFGTLRGRFVGHDDSGGDG